MKNVVIVHHTGDWGGGTKSLIDLCEMLRDDYNVIVCVPKGFPEFSEKIGQYGGTVHEMETPLPFINIYSGRPPIISVVTFRSIKSLFGVRKAGEEILSLKPDVVIFNTLITSVTARYLSKYTKVICIDRETLTSCFAKAFYRRILDKHLNAITFLSDCERRKLKFRHARSEVFPDCVHVEECQNADSAAVRKSEGIDTDKFVVLYMGGLARIKGPDVVLKALEGLDDRFLLVIAGAVNEKQLSRKQLLHDIKYPNIYFFKKRVKKLYYKFKGSPLVKDVGIRDSVDDLIVASDIVVFPSTSVHQPRPCIEAGAYNRPVIISDYEETKEYFIDGYNALTFKPCDGKDLARKLVYAYEHKEEMSEMGRNNRIMTVTKHNFIDCKGIICSLIDGVCDDTP